jgi:F-type H+-transporting ATPase subunit alpha
VSRWEKEFLEFIRDHRSGVRARLAKEQKLTDDILADLKAALTEFKTIFRVSAAKAPALAGAGA